MSDPYDQYMANWIKQKQQDVLLLARERNRGKIISYLEHHYVVKIENYGYHINAYALDNDEKPVLTMTTYAAEEMSVDQLVRWIKTIPSDSAK